MKHESCTNENLLAVYRQHYTDIQGGIDGYYERTILDSPVYRVFEDETMAYFSVHPERGLTSLVVLPFAMTQYDRIFAYVLGLPLFANLLFSEKDERFLEQVRRHNIRMEVQAYNFEAKQPIVSTIRMKEVLKEDFDRILDEFGPFIEYNRISLASSPSFYYAEDGELISFGSIEPLRLREVRYCVSMIVKEQHRNRGFGCETVKFLIEHLQSKGLEANARCYVHNAASKQTLLKSGLSISNRLFKATKDSA